MSINQAAIHYNLPYSSLYGRFKRGRYDNGGTDSHTDHSPDNTVKLRCSVTLIFIFLNLFFFYVSSQFFKITNELLSFRCNTPHRLKCNHIHNIIINSCITKQPTTNNNTTNNHYRHPAKLFII